MATTEKKPVNIKKKIEIGMAEAMFILGLLLLFAGLWLLVNLGLALTVNGALLVAVSVISSWWSAQPAIMARDNA